MRHGVDHRKLGRKPAHRKALLRNLMNALVHAERIETTVSKAKELRPLADRLITLGKAATLHSRRRVFSLLTDKEATDKLFATLAGRFVGRQGGYTRILRTGFRVGDGADPRRALTDGPREFLDRYVVPRPEETLDHDRTASAPLPSGGQDLAVDPFEEPFQRAGRP